MSEIEKGVPIPAKNTISRKYPFLAMEIGDSVFYAGQKVDGLVAAAARNVAQRNGLKFATRTVTENGTKGCRIWRTA